MVDSKDAGATASASSPRDFDSLLAQARRQFALVSDAESTLRTNMQDDKRFRAGEHWPDSIKAERERDKRPCLTIQRLPQFIKLVTNQARLQRPGIQVNPVDNDGDPETADVLQGMIRHIEDASHKDMVYDQAVEDQVTMGRGFIRIITQYESDESFNQELRLRKVPDPEQIYIDPFAVNAPFDLNFAFEVEDIDLPEFKRQYPKAQCVSLEDFEAIGDTARAWWSSNGTIRVANYYYVDLEPAELLRLIDGTTGYADELNLPKEFAKPYAQGGAVLERRDVNRRIVRCVKMTGAEVLDESVWPGKWIPFIPVLGDEIRLDGKVDYRGIVRESKDQQRLYDYQVTAMVEATALAPRAPFIVAEGQIEHNRRQWQNANKSNASALIYKPVTLGGVLVPKPERQSPSTDISSIVATVAQADNDLKATTGFYDASLGERGPEESGKAILARQKQSEIGSSHFLGNLGRSIWAVATLLIDAIPKVYDAPRVMRITGKDNKQQTVMVHAGNLPTGQDGQPIEPELPPGVAGIYDLSSGRYDVTVSVGPGDSTQRQQAVEMLTAAMQAQPELMGVAGDLYFSMMDHPVMRQIGQRLKKTLPPQFQDDDQEIPPAAAAQIAQLQTQLQETQAMLAEAAEEIRTKKIETDAKKEIELIRAEIDVLKIKADLAKQEQAAQQQREQAQMQIEADGERDANARIATVQDKTFDAELAEIQALREQAAAEAEHGRQRDNAREERAFQMQMAEQQAAQQGAQA